MKSELEEKEEIVDERGLDEDIRSIRRSGRGNCSRRNRRRLGRSRRLELLRQAAHASWSFWLCDEII